MTRRVPAIAAAPGRAVGPAWLHAPAGAPGGQVVADHAAAPSIREAADEAGHALAELGAGLRAAGREDEAGILEAQAVIAVDPSLLGAAERRVAAGAPPAAAVREAAAGIAARIAASANPRTAARASDILDVAERITRVMEGTAFVGPTRPSVVVGRDLPPSAIVEIPAGLLLGIALEEGSPTAHVAILARALGIPAVVGAGGLLDAVAGVGAGAAGDPDWLFVEVDGTAGWVGVGTEPPGTGAGGGAGGERAQAVAIPAEPLGAVGSAPAGLHRADAAAGPGTTADGHPIPLLANLGRPDDVDVAIAAGAEGVGLFRTESLFLGRAAAPSEEVQGAAYRRVFSAMGERPVVVRIADLGGDRLVPYLSGAPEVNPGLGVRGIRLARSDRWLHLAQLRAIARAAVDEGVAARVMAPMVATLGDVDLFRDLCDEAWSQATPGSVRPVIGAMVEVPAAALMADALARRVDYLSVGTNDLTQYALAADRGVAALASLQDALNPAVLRLVRMAVEAGSAAGIPVGACGVVAGEPDGALVLAGLGVDSLSMEPAAIGRVRAALGSARMPDLMALAEAALRAPDAATVRGLAAEVRGVSSSRP
jgi:phosphoenolpyruvate-protein kinase (PTS system EI component)